MIPFSFFPFVFLFPFLFLILVLVLVLFSNALLCQLSECDDGHDCCESRLRQLHVRGLESMMHRGKRLLSKRRALNTN